MRKVIVLGWIGVLVTGAAMVAAPQRAGARAVPDEPAWSGEAPPCFADAAPEGASPLAPGPAVMPRFDPPAFAVLGPGGAEVLPDWGLVWPGCSAATR
jgi:hypothetical protein